MARRHSSYAVITPARDEAQNIRRLARSLAEQTLRPTEWVIVDDDSADTTADVARDLAEREPWIKSVSSAAVASQAPLIDGRRSGRDVIAFNVGIESLEQEPDLVVKVDADVSFGRSYFEQLVNEFERDDTLGIASGACYERDGDRWTEVLVTRGHVRGASRAYRWECFNDIAPLEQRLGWDGIDELKASALGWKTQTVRNLAFFHHRAMGERDGSWRAWSTQGDTAHFMGYRVSYVVLRALFHAARHPAALALLWGYAAAVLRRNPVYGDSAVRAHLRRQQRLRSLPVRAREALGRSA